MTRFKELDPILHSQLRLADISFLSVPRLQNSLTSGNRLGQLQET